MFRKPLFSTGVGHHNMGGKPFLSTWCVAGTMMRISVGLLTIPVGKHFHLTDERLKSRLNDLSKVTQP